MPLFSNNNNNNPNKLEKRAGAGELTSSDYATTGTGHHTTGHHTTRMAGMNDDPYLGRDTAGMGQTDMMPGGGRHHQGYAAAEPAYGAAGGQHIPPTHAVNAGTGTGSGGGSMTGKIEHAVGSIVGSKSLKAKGLQKEEEARALKVQSSELAEAERLEREAQMRRDRAVAHGAHPENRHLGGNGGPGMYD